jgi:hypothetical protein
LQTLLGCGERLPQSETYGPLPWPGKAMPVP